MLIPTTILKMCLKSLSSQKGITKNQPHNAAIGIPTFISQPHLRNEWAGPLVIQIKLEISWKIHYFV